MAIRVGHATRSGGSYEPPDRELEPLVGPKHYRTRRISEYTPFWRPCIISASPASNNAVQLIVRHCGVSLCAPGPRERITSMGKWRTVNHLGLRVGLAAAVMTALSSGVLAIPDF